MADRDKPKCSCGCGATDSADEALKKKIADVITQDIRPMLVADGGDIEILQVVGKTVKVKLRGACCGCPHAALTLKRGVEQRLRNLVDQEILVENVVS